MNLNFSRTSLALLACLWTASALASEDALVTSVFSNTSNGYERKKLPDGTYKKEYYALANGRYLPGLLDNESIDKVKFPTIAGIVAQNLAKQNYFLAQDAKSADILLLVTWGTTIPFTDGGGDLALDRALNAMNVAGAAARAQPTSGGAQETAANSMRTENGAIREAAQGELEGQMVELQMFNSMRRKADERNARILGYVDEINRLDNATRFAGAGTSFDDLVSDIEEERYFIIISAYDFKTAVNEGKRKQLWATRISIRAQGNKFDERLGAMLARASGYFGRNTKGLLRDYQEGKVNIGELKVVGVDTDANAPAKPETK
jgi:hypothetical protein